MHRSTGRRSRAFLGLSVLLLAGAMATTAWAVDVRGTLRVASDYRPPDTESAEKARRNYYWDEWNGFVDPKPRSFDPSREFAVVLVGDGELAPEQPSFAFVNGALSPATLVERVGATLRIENTDPVAHQLYAEGHAELGPTPTSPGLTRQLVVNEAGSWPLRDRRYAHVTGHLHVLPDLVARAHVQSDGSYRFRNVPAGTYTLKVFHRDRELLSRQVVVPEDRELVVDPIEIGPAPAE